MNKKLFELNNANRIHIRHLMYLYHCILYFEEILTLFSIHVSDLDNNSVELKIKD